MEARLEERVHEENIMEPSYLFMVMGGAIICAIASEAINWFLIYRHEEYKELTKDILDSTNKLETQKEKLSHAAGMQSAN